MTEKAKYLKYYNGPVTKVLEKESCSFERESRTVQSISNQIKRYPRTSIKALFEYEIIEEIHTSDNQVFGDFYHADHGIFFFDGKAQKPASSVREELEYQQRLQEIITHKNQSQITQEKGKKRSEMTISRHASCS